MKIKDLINSDEYKDKHILNLILQEVLWLTKEQIFLKWDKEISFNDLNKIKDIYDKYEKEFIPIEYLLWYCEFMWERFFVNENVLIPRPETEYLISYVLEDIKNLKKENTLILDIWTGSWIIAVMLAKLTWFNVLAVDISSKALEIAKKNAQKILGSLGNINFAQSNLLKNINLDKSKDLIVCANLPYLEDNYKLDKLTEKEPKLALYAGEDGLNLYRQLIWQLRQLKNNNIVAYLELTKKQAYKLIEEFNLNWEVLETCHKNIKVLKIKI
jgi:release factor glutamine methyltransferase